MSARDAIAWLEEQYDLVAAARKAHREGVPFVALPRRQRDALARMAWTVNVRPLFHLAPPEVDDVCRCGDAASWPVPFPQHVISSRYAA